MERENDDFDIFKTHLEDSFELKPNYYIKNNSNNKKIKIKKPSLKIKKITLFKIIVVIIIMYSIMIVYPYVVNILRNINNKDNIVNEIPADIDTNVNIVEDTIEVRKEILELRNLYNNDDIVGVIEINNEIFVLPRGDDNNFYKNHDLYKNPSTVGNIFLNYINSSTDRNIIIYGNSLEGGSFEFMKNYNDLSYYMDNFLIYTKDNQYNCTWEIFSFYETEYNDFPIIQTDFLDENSFYINAIGYLNKSIYNLYDSNYIDENDYLLTLSGVTKEDNKNYFLHAKLIDKIEYTNN